MSNPAVFIPSRGRWSGARDLTKIWHSKDFDVHWIVEPTEFSKYADAIMHDVPITPPHSPLKTYVWFLDAENQGVAYARNFALNMAHSRGYKSIMLADDDIKPSTRRPDNMREIVDACAHPKILGMTARYSYHDLCLGPDVKYWDDIILLPTGTFRLVGLNVDNVVNKLGNYDWTLEYAEDCDLFLRGLQQGFPWMVHMGSWSNSIGTRYQPGGMLDFVGENDMVEKKKQWHRTMYDAWPKGIINSPDTADYEKQNPIRIQWQRAYDLYLPKWRDWSELHGGDLQRYIDGQP